MYSKMLANLDQLLTFAESAARPFHTCRSMTRKSWSYLKKDIDAVTAAGKEWVLFRSNLNFKF
jgi:hypothetical protein